MTRRVLCGVLLLAVALAVRASGSFPLGVYAVVDKVVYEPGEAEAQRVQIWGAFALWEDGEGTGYGAPQRGYLYYTCSSGQASLCRNEWRDLRSIAGTGQIVGFGSRSLRPGRVRASGEKAASPEPYPIQFGVVLMGSSPWSAIFHQLKAAAQTR